MTTIAGSFGNVPQQGSATPRNRAHDALVFAGPAIPSSESPSEIERDLAAGDIALAIRRGQALLSVRERMVLAAALLPEFDAPDGVATP